MTSRRASRRNGHRPRPRRRKSAVSEQFHELRENGDDVLVHPAWCDGSDEGIAEAKQITHDAVVDALGDTRTTAVGWVLSTTIASGNELCDQLIEGQHEDRWYDYIRQIRAHLREYGGKLVIAYASSGSR